MPTPTILTCIDEHEFLSVASHQILTRVNDILSRHETCHIGLAGGTTTKTLYRRLSELHIPWDRITLIIIDERNVPALDKQSNYGMIRDELIGNITIPHDNIIFFDTSLGYDSATLAMEQKLLQTKREREPIFDLLILGSGPDGHIAGIFPDTVTEKGFLTAKTSTDIFDIHDRLTCTMEALTSCEQALLLLKGHGKKHIFQEIQEKESSLRPTPVAQFIESVATTIIYSE